MVTTISESRDLTSMNIAK